MGAGIDIDGAERRIESALSDVATHEGIGQLYDLQATFDDDYNLLIVATLDCPQYPIPRICVAGTL